jgi:hypothetical protein
MPYPGNLARLFVGEEAVEVPLLKELPVRFARVLV